MSIPHDRPIVQDHIVHPISPANQCFRGQEVANRGGPMRRRHCGNDAAGIARRHRQVEDIGEVGNLLRLQQAAGIAHIELHHVTSLVDDEILESVAAG